ncbi:hypothetical protein ABZV29_23015 [Streptomyces sp. NPDC005236]|uniref:hypothetical protein n=1 Tax=Streptomyces sp. NPDC005236 TaxID=3157028 RepID=UPI0033B2337F
MNIAWELRGLLASLTREEGVFGRVSPEAEGSAAEQIRGLAVEAERDWERYALPGAIDPDSSAEVNGALVEVDPKCATDLMAYLAVDDLVFPGSPRRDRAHARRAAARVVELLGYESAWHANISDLSEQVRAWSSVTRHTFDGVVVGTGNGFTVVLLQVGED